MSFTPTRKGLPPELRARVPKRNNHEFESQSALFIWARIPIVIVQHPELRLLEGSANGVALSKAQAGKAYAAGVLKGSLDVRLPVARGGYIGMAFEMKAGKNKLTTEQTIIGDLLRAEGWLVDCFWDWALARAAILDYLAAPRTLEKTPAG